MGEEAIAVVMAVRNAEATLQVAVDSMRQQTHPPQEILLILNGCEDDSQSIGEALAAQDSRIHLLKSSLAGGVAEAAPGGLRDRAVTLDCSHGRR